MNQVREGEEMQRIVGAFIFPEVWQAWTEVGAAHAFESLLRFGVNSIFTESETYRDDLIVLAHRLGLRWFGAIACFSDHAHQNQILRDRPEMWPIDETGARRPQMEWYVGVVPTFEDYNASRIALAERIVRDHDLDGFMFDFIRWPIHWELELRPGMAEPRQCSFDPHTLARFQEETGIRLPESPGDGDQGEQRLAASRAAWILTHHAQAWYDFRCAVITRFCRQAVDALRSVRRSKLTVGFYALPLPMEPLARIAGQRLSDLAPLVDLIAPMVYHAIVHRPAQWVGDTVRAFASSCPGQVLPVVQVDSAEGAEVGADWGPPIPVSEWEEVLRVTLAQPGVRGLVAFTGTALFRTGRGERLRTRLESSHLGSRGD